MFLRLLTMSWQSSVLTSECVGLIGDSQGSLRKVLNSKSNPLREIPICCIGLHDSTATQFSGEEYSSNDSSREQAEYARFEHLIQTIVRCFLGLPSNPLIIRIPFS